MIKDAAEEPIEEEIEPSPDAVSPSPTNPNANTNNQATVNEWSENATVNKPSRNKQDEPYHTFALPEE